MTKAYIDSQHNEVLKLSCPETGLDSGFLNYIKKTSSQSSGLLHWVQK